MKDKLKIQYRKKYKYIECSEYIGKCTACKIVL